MSLITFYNADVETLIRNKRKLTAFVSFLFCNEKKPLQSINVILCSDQYLISLNKKFLNHKYYTDILTFNLSENEKIVGEIYISIDRVKENGMLHNSSFQLEFCRVLFHGALHLCGYFDKSKKEKRIMTEMEDFYLEKYASFHVKQI